MRMGGVTEVADILGISRQRVAKLRQRQDFPDPIAEIAQWAGLIVRATTMTV